MDFWLIYLAFIGICLVATTASVGINKKVENKKSCFITILVLSCFTLVLFFWGIDQDENRLIEAGNAKIGMPAQNPITLTSLFGDETQTLEVIAQQKEKGYYWFVVRGENDDERCLKLLRETVIEKTSLDNRNILETWVINGWYRTFVYYSLDAKDAN